MAITKEIKEQIKKEHQLHESDTGSVEVQVALLTRRINDITAHLQQFKKDHHSRRSLLIMVGQRRGLLDYLKKKDYDRYQALIQKLNIRR
ncbi:MAG: 30S ribosomal protein S15 [Candidatus Auribacterota bacterium]|jgi:small subunit ribosomal protein S15|uniref:Small ribosomal subunit protein uS15 n=1 Tax=Candidatus Auribacter fodinae TaxID=2093366 RepID=A0A3A4QYN3_9BACT|nr:MAG: 30S ribosomal protein S15 [Candidatus Auribacter fodinae]